MLREVTGESGGVVRRPLDLRDWKKQGPPNNGNWKLSNDGKTVRQTNNDAPHFFVAPGDVINTTVCGRLKVEDRSDDDFIGFVFGYQRRWHGAEGEGPLRLLPVRLEGRRPGGAREGFVLTRVLGELPIVDDTRSPWWNHKTTPEFQVLAEDYGKGKGWRPGVDYEFELAYHEDRIRISINGKTIFELKSPKSPNPTGRFGFYNNSQAGVVYSGFTHQPAPRIQCAAQRRAWGRTASGARPTPTGPCGSPRRRSWQTWGCAPPSRT